MSETFNHKADNKRITKNTLVLYIRTGLVLFVSLYISRILLNNLGINDYGIYNVVGSIVVLFSFLSNSLSQAIQRFISFHLGKDDNKRLVVLYNMSLVTQLIVAIVLLLLCESIGLWLVTDKLNIPDGREFAAMIAFQFSVLTLVVNVFRTVYEAILIAEERMSTYAYLCVFDIILKLMIAVLISIGVWDNLIFYTFLLSIESIVVVLVYSLCCKKLVKYCILKKCWDANVFKSLLAFSGWSLLGSSTNVLTQKGFLVLLNIFYGVIANAAMGIANQINAAVSQFVVGFQAAFKPQLVKSYASNDDTYFNSLLRNTTIISFLLGFIPGMIIIFNISYILHLWLGTNVPTYTEEFSILIILCTILDCTTGPISYGVIASGKIKKYQILISFNFIIDIIVSFLLMSSNILPQYILFSRLITRGLLNGFVAIICLKNNTDFRIKSYITKFCVPAIFVIILTVIPVIILKSYIHNQLLNLVISTLVITTLSFLWGYMLFLDRNQRTAILYGVKQKITSKLC